MATLDRPEQPDNNEDKNREMTDEEKVVFLKQQELIWQQKEKNYLSELSEAEKFSYQVFKRKIFDLNRVQAVLLLQEYYLYAKRQEVFTRKMFAKQLENM